MPTRKQLNDLRVMQHEFPWTRYNGDRDGGHYDIPDRKPSLRNRSRGTYIGYFIWNPIAKDLKLIVPLRAHRPPRKVSPINYNQTTHHMVYHHDNHGLKIVPKT